MIPPGVLLLSEEKFKGERRKKNDTRRNFMTHVDKTPLMHEIITRRSYQLLDGPPCCSPT